MTDFFELNGTEYGLIEPLNSKDLVMALQIKSLLKSQINRSMFGEDANQYEILLQRQEDCIQEYINGLGTFDNTYLIKNINHYLEEHAIRMGELEQMIGVSAGYISRIAKAGSAKKISIDLVWKLARLFETDVQTLISVDLGAIDQDTLIVMRFLQKLCEQTLANEIVWRNCGGASRPMDEMLRSTDIFSEQDGSTIYHPGGSTGLKQIHVLTDDIYACDSIAKGMSLTMIGFMREHDSASCNYNFIFLNADKGQRGKDAGWKKAFYSSEDRYGIVGEQAARLMQLVQLQEKDARLSKDVRGIIANYLS